MTRSLVLVFLICAACGDAGQKPTDCAIPQMSGAVGEQLLVTAEYSDGGLRFQFFLDRCTPALKNVYFKPFAYDKLDHDMREIPGRSFDGVMVGILNGSFDRTFSNSQSVLLIDDVYRVYPWVDLHFE
uniref:hypothetical protein n=1 Tax=Altererythrobacter segetis TaxID=1104773 RepID=UPI00140AD494|nr:hypothetical protein [Altererythrobacter segetis]